MDDKSALLLLNSKLDEPYKTFNYQVLLNRKFNLWAGATRNHHVFEGGLLRHTNEVAQVANFTASLNPKINKNILLTAVFWHDFGKIWDFEPLYDEISHDIRTWIPTDHKQKIYHVCRSYAEFFKAGVNVLPAKEFEHIGHCILSHHNLPEWNSPREPQTPEAWALHLADMTSAWALDDRAKFTR